MLEGPDETRPRSAALLPGVPVTADEMVIAMAVGLYLAGFFFGWCWRGFWNWLKEKT